MKRLTRFAYFAMGLSSALGWAKEPLHPLDAAPGVKPHNNPFNPSAKGGGGGFFDDEEDDDDLYNFDEPPLNPAQPRTTHTNPGTPPSSYPNAPSRPSYSAPPTHTFSAGGTPNNVPDPIMTEKGIAIGGAPANGLINKNKMPIIKIDDETAEGSKDIVTDFNFPDAEIMDIAKTLGKLTGKNFILDKEVKGKITIISNTAITVGEAWKVFLTALDINGFALIPSGKYLRIARQRDAREKQLKTYTTDRSPDTDALITRVFSLKYISAEEVTRTFRSFMPANSRIISYEQTNTVIVTDTGSNITKLAKMLEILDVEGYEAGIEVVPVKYASAAELSKLIDALIPGTATTGPGGGPPGVPRFGGGGASKFSARRTKEGGIINTIIADDRTNTLIVHANTKGADQVRELVAKLDQKLPASTGGGKVHVVYLQFADAEQLANTLNNFSQNSTTRATPTGGTGSGTGTNPNEASLFQGSIKISPDKATNALVITASATDFVTVQRVINRLDIPREQVYIEVIIMEVQVGNNFSFSANIASPPILGSVTKSEDLTSLFMPNTTPLSTPGVVLGFQGGNTVPITINGQTINVSSVIGLVKALQTNAKSNVLATPQIIALDNTEANFESAEKIPYLTSNAVQGVAQQNIQKESVAVSIKIKPQISKISNFVKLDITAKLGDILNRVLPSAVSSQAFATLDRTTQTTVVVGDTDTVVLGGLIRDSVKDTTTKIPILGDIPILGWLFRSKTTEMLKSNLLIFLTPRIIRQYEKIRMVLDKKLKERDEFIDTNVGGEDGLRTHRDAMIRSLPDVKDLGQKRPASVTIDEDKPAAVAVGAESSSAAGSLIHSGALNPEERITSPADAPAQPSPAQPSIEAGSSPASEPITAPLPEAPPAPREEP